MKLNRRNVKRGRVEIIPMIDTILILLIFYMSFSTFDAKEKSIDSKMPITPKNAVVKPEKEIVLDIVLHVSDARNVTVNGANTMDLVNLQGYMAQLGQIGQKATVVIEAEPSTKYSDVIGALDSCALANLTNVAFRPLSEKVASAK